ncbi:MAG: HAMP domain-containing sensor histidine kinase, partial [Ignavibacteriaceae bacterium]
LRSLFINLIENSIESMNRGGEIEISSELKGDQCYIYVKDNGCGVNCVENIFEPFVTTKSTGTGLGLPIVKNIIDKHHGSIKLVTSKRGETLFEIILPSKGGRIGKTTDN